MWKYFEQQRQRFLQTTELLAVSGGYALGLYQRGITWLQSRLIVRQHVALQNLQGFLSPADSIEVDDDVVLCQ